MTDKEIIQALECCIKPTSDCENCPYYKNDECFDMAKGDALNLIVRQQAEIGIKTEQRLWTESSNRDLINILKERTEELKTAQAEIEKLKADIRTVDQDLYELDRPLTEIKAEAIKEFAEKLADVFYSHDKGDTYVREVVYNLAKEMAGEDK
jgi:hypothetical protein